MRFAKYSPELTRAAGFRDKRSKIGLKPDGSQLVRLAGKDMEALHARVFEYHGWKCFEDKTIGYYISDECEGKLELSHDIPRGRGGSDVDSNVKPRCQKHHRLRDNREVHLRSGK